VVRERPIDLLGQRLTEEHIGETSSQLLRGRLRVAGSKTREGEHPQALMQLVGELQLSPSLCPPHQADVDAMGFGIGVAEQVVAHRPVSKSTPFAAAFPKA